MEDEAAAYIAEEVGCSHVSDWIFVDQAMIDRFADATHDWQFIHVDPARAAQTHLGGTVAHGFLTLSLLAPMRGTLNRPVFPGLKLGLNYGLDRVRFLSPVRSGSRVRGTFTITAITRTAPGRYREEMTVAVEIEGEERPALAATWITMYVTE